MAIVQETEISPYQQIVYTKTKSIKAKVLDCGLEVNKFEL